MMMMQYRIKVALPEVYHESICHWQPIHWESNAVTLTEAEKKLTVESLIAAVGSGEVMSIEPAAAQLFSGSPIGGSEVIPANTSAT